MVEWVFNRKAHPAHLLYRLFTEGFCFIRGSKGYFAFAEQHFKDFHSRSLSNGALRKLSSRINKNQSKFLDVVREVEDILEEVRLLESTSTFKVLIGIGKSLLSTASARQKE